MIDENEKDDSLEEIQKYISVNEIQTQTSLPFIAAIEQCLSKSASSSTRNRWYQKYSLSDSYAKDNGEAEAPKYLIGDEVSAIEAVNDPELRTDSRPRFFDNITKTWSLLDSGSCVSCIPKQPNDKIDSKFKLRAVNGQSIPTFGTEMVQIRIGRKTYEIEAIKTEIPQRILGWDLFQKYNLGFEWGPFGDLFLTDKKSDTKALLKFVKLKNPQRIATVESYEEPKFYTPSAQEMLFEYECMKQLSDPEINAMTIHPDQASPVSIEDIPFSSDIDSEADDSHKANLAALRSLPPEYKALVERFPSILRTNFKKTPSRDIYHRIETTGQPFKSKMRPLLANSEKSKEGKKVWDEMIKLGVIEQVKPNTTLQYTSPVHLVKKPSGVGWRICADFRLLNQQTKSDNYPLPLLRSFQAKIKGSKLFSKLDLKSAFHHLPIHPQDVYKTCVLSPWGGAYVYKRLAFGLTNGPSSWQKYIDSVLSGIDGIFCYLDDILVCSENVDQHLSTLTEIFKRLQEHELTLALDKCTFAEDTIDYLGYEVSATGIRPLKRKTEAINRIPPPATQKQLLQFLGALNYFRSCLSGLQKDGKYKNAASLLQPLYSAATVSIPAGKFPEIWSNSPILQEAFADAKLMLKQSAQLVHPDPSLPLALMTDASQHSVGSVLMQRSRSGKWFPLGYMSKHLPVDKSHWSTCRKELLAAQSGLRHFISEIYGRHCSIFSDHAPLVLAFKNPNGFQLHDPVAQRALMEIGQFTKDVRHIEGLKNTGSDYLSRIPPNLKGSAYEEASIELAAIEGHKLECLSPQVIFEAQQKCKEVELAKAGKHANSVIFQAVQFGEFELLSEVSQSKPRPLLPKNLRQFVIKQMHYAHKGIKETTRLIASHYYWSDMKAEIARYVQTCDSCQSTNSTTITPPHYGKFEVPDQRFSHCHIDIVGPLPPSEGFKYILTVIDRTTRQLSALPVKEPSAKACSQAFLLHYVALYGLPSACTSDQGSNFVSSLFQEMQRNLGIQINHTPIYWPQGNGLIERAHQTLKNSIKAQLLEMGQKYQNEWIHVLPWALLGQRTAFNKDLGTSSNELTLGTHVQVPGCVLSDVKFNSAEPNITDILTKLQIKNDRLPVPTSVNQQTPVGPPANVSHVYVKQHDTRGLQPRFRGPFKILSRPSRSTLEIKVGLTAKGDIRSELRAWADCKPAYMREDTVEASRPKRGRPAKNASSASSDTSPTSDINNNIATTEPAESRNLLSAIDFSVPPPNFRAGNSKTWQATTEELRNINLSINQPRLWE